MYHFWAQNTLICPEQIFLVQTVIITSIYLLAPFILQNFEKILRANPELWGLPFLGPKYPNLLWTKFFDTNYYDYFHLPNGPFHSAKFLETLRDNPELWGCAIFEPKMAHLPKWQFFSEKLLMSLVSFINAYLHAKNQSQILI